MSLLSPTQGQAPYQLEFRLSATGAIVWHTTVTGVQGGHAFTVLESGADGGDFSPMHLSPGPASTRGKTTINTSASSSFLRASDG